MKYLELEDVATKQSGTTAPERKDEAQTDLKDPSSQKKCRKGDENSDNREHANKHNGSKTKPCWHFENRTCSYGEQCRYQHRKEYQRIKDNKEKDKSNPERRKSSSKNLRSTERRQREKNEEYCWYDENTRCRFGERCEDKHRKRGEKIRKKYQQTDPKTTDPCWYYENTECIFGERCKNKHGIKEFNEQPNQEESQAYEDQESTDGDEEEKINDITFLENRVAQEKENLYQEVLMSPWV